MSFHSAASRAPNTLTDYQDLIRRVRDIASERAGGGPPDDNYDPELLMAAFEAADAIEALIKERDHWRDARRNAIEAGDMVVAERDAALADARRYRWLRGPRTDPRWDIRFWRGYWDIPEGNEFDAAVDAAMDGSDEA